jgi:N-acetylmuramoyl-L-alanine amidase
MLDPGHGGKDKGGLGKRFYEKTIALSLTRKVANLLRARGYKVYLTRASDRFINLKKRPALAARVGADIFVSIHANKAKNTSVSGIESFYMTPRGATSTYSRKPSNKGYQSNYNDANNIALSYWIQRSLIAKTKAIDRGIKQARFMVLKEATCPATLIEVGFLSNSREENRLGTQWYQNKLAQGIVEGILRYHYQLKRSK